ncbi:hypothetical protein AAC387_Pa07g1574 [Persea americana]
MVRKRKSRPSCYCPHGWQDQKTPEVSNENTCQTTGDSQRLSDEKTSGRLSHSFEPRTPECHSSASSSRRISSSSVTKTVSSFDSRRMNVLDTNSEQPPPRDDMALRIQQLEQRQQRIDVLMENLLLTL